MTAKGPWMLALSLAIAGCAGGPRPEEGLGRAIWVSRWDWRTADDVRDVIGRCADLGCTAVFFQVRGNGTVLFASRQEVWSEGFGFAPPGFDPLRVAIAAGRARGVDVHAWINVTPGWRGKEAPGDPRQLWRARADWFLEDRAGAREPLGRSGYLGLNPCLAEVRAYLAGLCAEVAEVPGLAGLHLDYLRFTSGDHDGIDAFPDDPATRRRFAQETGGDPGDAAAFRAWKVDCVTALLRAIRGSVKARAPALPLTVAVLADPERALASGQDWPAWARAGLADALVPMTYTDDDAAFARLLAVQREAAGSCPLVAGIGIYKHGDAEQTLAQMRAARRGGAAGVALFGYGELAKPERSATAAALSGSRGARL